MDGGWDLKNCLVSLISVYDSASEHRFGFSLSVLYSPWWSISFISHLSQWNLQRKTLQCSIANADQVRRVEENCGSAWPAGHQTPLLMPDRLANKQTNKQSPQTNKLAWSPYPTSDGQVAWSYLSESGSPSHLTFKSVGEPDQLWPDPVSPAVVQTLPRARPPSARQPAGSHIWATRFPAFSALRNVNSGEISNPILFSRLVTFLLPGDHQAWEVVLWQGWGRAQVEPGALFVSFCCCIFFVSSLFFSYLLFVN